MYLSLCQLCSSSSLTMYLTLFDSLWRVHVYVWWGTFYKPISTKVTCTNTKPYRVLFYQAQQVDRTCNPKGTLFYQPHQIFCKDPVLVLSTSSHTLHISNTSNYSSFQKRIHKQVGKDGNFYMS